MKNNTVENKEKKVTKAEVLSISVNSKEILTLEEAAFYMGYKAKYIYQLKHQGKIRALPKRRKRSKLFFEKKELEQYLRHENVEYEDFEKEVLASWQKNKKA